MAYTPDASNSSQPTDDVKASTAAAEFRALKAYLASAILGVAPVFRNYIDGFQFSPAGGSVNMPISAGQATDSGNTVLMSYAGGTKTTAAWAVGSAAGSWARAGAITVAGTVHWYSIRRPDTGVVDVCSTSSASGLVAADYVAGGGNIPAEYTQFRRINSWLIAASLWTKLIQRGDMVIYDVPVQNYNEVVAVATSFLIPVSIPTGVKLAWFGGVQYTGVDKVVISDPDLADNVAGVNNIQLQAADTGGQVNNVFTNTSAQLRARLETGTGASLRIGTHGWIDTRGRNG